MERWWLRNPWRGIGIRERLRLFRLSTSGERIDDPSDAQLVHAYLQSMALFNGSVGWRFIDRVGPFLVIPMFTVGLVLWALRGDVWHSVLDGVLIAGYVLLLRRGRLRLQRQRQTAEANDWNDLG